MRISALTLLVAAPFVVACDAPTLVNESSDGAELRSPAWSFPPAALYDAQRYGFGIDGLNARDISEDVILRMADRAASAGVKWARHVVYWPQLQPDARHTWDSWQRQREHFIIDAFQSRGIQMVVTLQNTAKWACYGDSPCLTDPTYAPDDFPSWYWFVADVVAEFPTVHYWSIWNEPDSHFLKVRPGVSREHAYRELVGYAGTAIHAIPGKFLVAPEGGSEVFLDSVLSTMAHQVDIIAIHHYGKSFDVESYVNAFDQVGRRYRAGGYPIWITEAGIPVNKPADRDAQPTDAQQAAHITDLLKRMDANSVTNWRKTFPYHLFGPYGATDLPGYRYFHDALTTNPIARPAYYCYQSLAKGLLPSFSCTDQTQCEHLPEGGWNDPDPRCLVMRLAGPARVRSGYWCIWSAVASATKAPITYQWFVNGQPRSTNGSFGWASTSSFYLSVTVTDGWGHTMSQGRLISVEGTGGCS